MIEPPLERRRVVERLIAERPKFHGETEAGSASYAIGPDMLFWLVDHVPPGAETIETGCGYSTVAFSTTSARHLAVSPFPGEHELIRQWCRQHGLHTDQVEFIAEPSQRFLPTLEADGFDVVLIDGDHAFPAPFIDWYYLAEKVKPGGFVVVDDTQLVTGKILRDFLAQEEGRWSLEREVARAAVFRRISASPVVEGFNWTRQPYVRDLSRSRAGFPTRVARRLKGAVGTVLPRTVKDAIRERIGQV